MIKPARSSALASRSAESPRLRRVGGSRCMNAWGCSECNRSIPGLSCRCARSAWRKRACPAASASGHSSQPNAASVSTPSIVKSRLTAARASKSWASTQLTGVVPTRFISRGRSFSEAISSAGRSRASSSRSASSVGSIRKRASSPVEQSRAATPWKCDRRQIATA